MEYKRMIEVVEKGVAFNHFLTERFKGGIVKKRSLFGEKNHQLLRKTNLNDYIALLKMA